jgi:hypothetical protein
MKLKLLAAALAVCCLPGCFAYTAGGDNYALGYIYSGYKSSGHVGTAQASKRGQACVSSVLGAIATGDASLEEAKRAGGITQIAFVDHEQFSILGIYATTCTIVHGQ